MRAFPTCHDPVFRRQKDQRAVRPTSLGRFVVARRLYLWREVDHGMPLEVLLDRNRVEAGRSRAVAGRSREVVGHSQEVAVYSVEVATHIQVEAYHNPVATFLNPVFHHAPAATNQFPSQAYRTFLAFHQ